MVKQLGLLTLFLTLSCADLRWEELLIIFAKLNNIQLDLSNVDYYRKCHILNQNPVLTAGHVQYRVEVFFKEILLHKNSPVSQVKNYVIKVEFQFRGSCHIHSFLWITNSPTLTTENKEEYAKFVDQVIRADLPDPIEEHELHALVKQYQVHEHSKNMKMFLVVFTSEYFLLTEKL